MAGKRLKSAASLWHWMRGVRLEQQGWAEKAVRRYRSALRARPDFADAHMRIVRLSGQAPETVDPSARGALVQAHVTAANDYVSQRDFGAAAAHVHALSVLEPEAAAHRGSGAMLYLAAGMAVPAIAMVREALRLDPSKTETRRYFTRAMILRPPDPAMRDWIAESLGDETDIGPDRLAAFWLFLLQAGAPGEIFRAGMACPDYKTFRDWFQALPAGAAAGLGDAYFLTGLRCVIACDLAFEAFLTHLRRALLERLSTSGEQPHWFLPLAVALAMQCFLTEFIFSETADETAALARLRATDSQTILAVMAAYRPLATLDFPAAQLATLRDDPVMAPLVRRQIDEPRQERQLAAALPRLTDVTDPISTQVRAQYEENPYPRWHFFGTPGFSYDFIAIPDEERRRPSDILIAGCGTGEHAAYVCLRQPQARVTAFDLSLASLGYAARKAQELGLAHLSLYQGDILELGAENGGYDIVESVGVLHHLENPEQGWRKLTDRLRPGGLMKIGLYSAAARRDIIAGQDFVRQRGFPATLEGLRAAREAIKALSAIDPVRTITRMRDFYSASMLRDALFHVQEHNFTIARIAAALDQLGLVFIDFAGLPDDVRTRHAARMNAEGADSLTAWAAEEAAHPEIFIAMYQFWCRKPGM